MTRLEKIVPLRDGSELYAPIWLYAPIKSSQNTPEKNQFFGKNLNF